MRFSTCIAPLVRGIVFAFALLAGAGSAYAIDAVWQWGVLAAAALVLLAGRPAIWALGGGALAGVAAWLAGAPSP